MAQGLDQFGFAQARHAFEQHIAARQQRGHRALDHPLLPDDDSFMHLFGGRVGSLV